MTRWTGSLANLLNHRRAVSAGSGFLQNQSGATHVLVGVSMFALMGLAGLGFDATIWYKDKRDIQTVADLAVLGGLHALLEDGFRVFDAHALVEEARRIKSPEEVACRRWSIAVAEHGMEKMREALRPGIRETQLWALLNYVNVANDGEWHDSRQLTSGPRTNPFLREAEERAIEDGDLVAFDTDMIGPFGYCADLSRTFHCGPSRPSVEQRDLYKRAYEQLQHNMALIECGATYHEIAARAHGHPEDYHSLDLIMHGIGMCDELPFILSSTDDPRMAAGGVIEPGMALCVEAYAGRLGGPQGVKLEEQVLVTAQGIEVLSRFPFEAALLD